jgi:hypothetical protein
MNFDHRLQRLEGKASQVIVAKEVEKRLCKGMAWDELLCAVEDGIRPEDEDLIQQILGYADEAAATPLRDYGNGQDGELVLDEEGKPVYDHHFFVSWLWGLQAGSWTLPEKLARRFLEGFCHRHGMVRQRCEDCLCGLGNAISYDACSICGSDNLSHKYLGGPPWDPDFIYRRHDQVVQERNRGKVA